jgi:hypothetical protein
MFLLYVHVPEKSSYSDLNYSVSVTFVHNYSSHLELFAVTIFLLGSCGRMLEAPKNRKKKEPITTSWGIFTPTTYSYLHI